MNFSKFTNKEYNDPPRPQKKFWKFWILMVFINFGFLLVAVKLFSLQVISGKDFRERAEKQHRSSIVLSADRGDILDRKGRLLATTVMGYSVAVDPKLVENPIKIANALAKISDKSENYYKDKITKTKSRFVFLKRGIDPISITEIKELKDKGLIIINEPRRKYPYKQSGLQLIGLCDVDNKGISGIELWLNSHLNGINGYMIMHRDALGRLKPAADLPLIEAINGGSVQLTIDIEVQKMLEYELEQGVKESGAAAATAILLDPNTGDIIAAASYPNFIPGSSQSSQEGLRIRAITDTYEPGSTFKLITAAIAMEEGIVHEEQRLYGYGGTAKYNGYVIRDVHGLDSTTFREAMHQSSNIIMGNLANKIEDNKFYSYVRNFGFGLTLGVELPGEVGGFIPKPKDFHHSTKRYMGHGYALTVTPLQMATAYSVVANKGILMKPHIVIKIISKNQDNEIEIKQFDPEKVRKVISDSTSIRLWDLLRGVVDSGSGKKARIGNMKVAGKTGTSQQIIGGKYSKSDYYASFGGFFPADNPSSVLMVTVDRPRASIYGGASAAPIFRNIVARMINSSPEYVFKKTGENMNDTNFIVPPALGLSTIKAQKLFQYYNLDYAFTDKEGIIFHQSPKEGSVLNSKTKILSSVIPLQHDSTLNVKHSVINMNLRTALFILANHNIETSVSGRGVVKEQVWSNKNGKTHCLLICGN